MLSVSSNRTYNNTRGFSVEIYSIDNLRSLEINLTDNKYPDLQITGNLGKLKDITFVENIVLEIKTSTCVIRLDVSPKDLRNYGII